MINIELEKPLVFFDLEATGLNVIRDRVVQIGMIKYIPGSDIGEELNMLVNPGLVPISEEAFNVHGISAEDVANKPTFPQIAEKLFRFIGEADLAGYNSDRFDIPMLLEEFARSGIDFSMKNRRTIDVQKLFYKMEPRTLKAAYRFYCDKELEMAHDALADVRATADVLVGQIERYKDVSYGEGDEKIDAPIQPNVAALSDFTTNKDALDAMQRLKYDKNGVVVINFGKYMGKPAAETMYNDKGYFDWIQNKDFSVQVKQITRELVEAYAKSLKD